MINKVLKTMGHKAKLKQSDVSKKCNIANTTLSGYETGYREPTFETIEKIADACGYDIYFVNRNTKEQLDTKNIERKEI